MAAINPIRIRLRYADLDSFVEKFAPNVTRGGVFLASRNVQPVGAILRFEIQLLNGDIVLSGEGRVTWVKEFNPSEPNRAYGMGVQFTVVDQATKPILARILRAKEAPGQPRRTTGRGMAPVGPGSSLSHGTVGGSPLNGTAAAGVRSHPPVDTSVDLVAEFGLDETAVRRLIDRTSSWMAGSRVSDDLADLSKPEPIDTPTLAQALAELPRLLDPKYSRRRASSVFRTPDVQGASGTTQGDAVPKTVAASDSTPMDDGDTESGLERSQTGDTNYNDPADTTDMSEAGGNLGRDSATPGVVGDITHQNDIENTLQATPAQSPHDRESVKNRR